MLNPLIYKNKKPPVQLFFPVQEIILWFALSITILLVGCESTKPSQAEVPSLKETANEKIRTYWPDKEWRTSTLEEQGIDSREINDVFKYIQESGNKVHSIQMLRNGFLVLDAYFYPFKKGYAHDLGSATKSVTSLLMGMVLEQENGLQEEQKILDVFADHPNKNRNGDKTNLTIQHLLTNTSGLDCEEDGSDVDEMRQHPDWVQYILDMPIVNPPGSKWSYCSRNAHLLSGIITQKTGKSAEAFATNNLFSMLGIKKFYWESSPRGITHGWGDLSLEPLDALRLGYLILNNGKWKNHELISSEWLERSFQNRTPLGFWNELFYGNYEYGYSWWIHNIAEMPVIEARGRGGQLITISREKDIVLVLNGDGIEREKIAKLLLRSVKSEQSLPSNPEAYQKLLNHIKFVKTSNELLPTIDKLPLQASQLKNQTYVLESNSFQLQKISFDVLTPQEMVISLDIFGKKSTILVGLDNHYRFSEGIMSSALLQRAKGTWVSPNEFVMDLHEISRFRHLKIHLTFSENEIHFQINDMIIKGRKYFN